MDSVHMSWGWLVALALGVGFVGVIATALDDGRSAVDILAITAASDAELVEVVVRHHACGLPRPGVTVAEDDAVVSLRAVYDDSGDCEDAIVPSTVSVDLAEPLGARMIEVRSVGGTALSCEIDGEVSDRCFRG